MLPPFPWPFLLKRRWICETNSDFIPCAFAIIATWLMLFAPISIPVIKIST